MYSYSVSRWRASFDRRSTTPHVFRQIRVVSTQSTKLLYQRNNKTWLFCFFNTHFIEKTDSKCLKQREGSGNCVERFGRCHRCQLVHSFGDDSRSHNTILYFIFLILNFSLEKRFWYSTLFSTNRARETSRTEMPSTQREPTSQSDPLVERWRWNQTQHRNQFHPIRDWKFAHHSSSNGRFRKLHLRRIQRCINP